MSSWSIFWTMILVVQGVLGTPEQYTGDSVYQLTVKNEQQVEYLRTLEEKGYDFWTEIHVGPVDVRIHKNDIDEVINGLKGPKIDAKILIEDLDGLVKQSKTWMSTKTASSRRRSGALGHNHDWTSYQPFENIQSYMQYLADTFDYVSLKSIGKTYQGRDMQVLQVCKGGCGNKPAMWVDGGIHPREWISPASVTFLMRELVENNVNHTHLTEKLDWYILPVFNPDGYVYTLEKRFWRKTMSGYKGNKNDTCFGADLNRNWGYKWNTGGSSNDSCSTIYMGPSPFSEVETRNVRDFVWTRRKKIKYFISIHSYGNSILLPWAHTVDTIPDNFVALRKLANQAANKMYEVNETGYIVGCIPCLYGAVSGDSADWAMGMAKIPYVYGLELRPQIGGDFEKGFMLPPEQIIPTGKEAFAFHQTVGEQIIKEFGMKKKEFCTGKPNGTSCKLPCRNEDCYPPYTMCYKNKCHMKPTVLRYCIGKPENTPCKIPFGKYKGRAARCKKDNCRPYKRSRAVSG